MMGAKDEGKKLFCFVLFFQYKYWPMCTLITWIMLMVLKITNNRRAAMMIAKRLRRYQ